jgi:regulator of protease activity HflC (stomatin/prohibitin superfamily)
MSSRRDQAGQQALEQAVSWGFRFLYMGVALLVLTWLASGFVTVEPGNRAVIMRFGEVVQIGDPGLVWVWPRPIDTVIIVPGPERQLTQDVFALDQAPPQADALPSLDSDLDQRKNSYALTGDGGVVQIKGVVIYQVTDAALYLLAQERLAPALERTFCASAIAAIATRHLDGVVVVNAATATLATAMNANQREALRGDIRLAMNRRLQVLELGITVSRIDLSNQLPQRARSAFEQVIAAENEAARIVASAQTDAENYRQQGLRDQVEKIQSAEAKAKELVSTARVTTAGIVALNAERSPQQRALLLTRLYRDRLEGILRKTGILVSLVDGREPIRLFLPSETERK